MDKFTITNESIEAAVASTGEFLRKSKVEQKDVLRLTLALEDTLLNYRDTLGGEAECTLRCVRHLGRLRVELRVSGRSCDVLSSDDETDFSRMLLSGIGLAPVWQYKNGANLVTFTAKKKKPSQLVYILGAAVLALICGLLSGYLPAELQAFFTDQLLSPIADTFLGLLNAVAGMMIFLSVVWSICGIGDVATLTNIGKKTISHMLLVMVLLPSVFALCIRPLFHFTGGAGEGAVDISGLFSMLLGIIPSNLLTPFVEGNFLQIVFIAAIVGVALLVLGAKASMLFTFIEQASSVIQLIMEVLCSFVSLVIFITVYSMVLTGDFSALVEAYKIPLLTVGGCLASMLLYLCWICFSKKVSPAVLLPKLLPAFLIGLTTASSAAALSPAMDTCEKQCGVDKRLVNFSAPLGQIIFGIGSVVEFVVLSFCMAEIYELTVTPVWLIMAVLTSVILTAATPPIAGGGVAICAILFSQLGLPDEGLAVAVAIDMVVDFVLTATNVFCRQCEIVVLAGKLDMLDTEVLRSRKK